MEERRILRMPRRTPRANALCERFLWSVRRECLDQLLILGERHPARAPREYIAYFNQRDRTRASARRSRNRRRGG